MRCRSMYSLHSNFPCWLEGPLNTLDVNHVVNSLAIARRRTPLYRQLGGHQRLFLLMLLQGNLRAPGHIVANGSWRALYRRYLCGLPAPAKRALGILCAFGEVDASAQVSVICMFEQQALTTSCLPRHLDDTTSLPNHWRLSGNWLGEPVHADY